MMEPFFDVDDMIATRDFPSIARAYELKNSMTEEEIRLAFEPSIAPEDIDDKMITSIIKCLDDSIGKKKMKKISTPNMPGEKFVYEPVRMEDAPVSTTAQVSTPVRPKEATPVPMAPVKAQSPAPVRLEAVPLTLDASSDTESVSETETEPETEAVAVTEAEPKGIAFPKKRTYKPRKAVDPSIPVVPKKNNVFVRMLGMTLKPQTAIENFSEVVNQEITIVDEFKPDSSSRKTCEELELLPLIGTAMPFQQLVQAVAQKMPKMVVVTLAAIVQGLVSSADRALLVENFQKLDLPEVIPRKRKAPKEEEPESKKHKSVPAEVRLKPAVAIPAPTPTHATEYPTFIKNLTQAVRQQNDAFANTQVQTNTGEIWTLKNLFALLQETHPQMGILQLAGMIWNLTEHDQHGALII